MKKLRYLTLILSTICIVGLTSAQELTEDQVPLNIQSYLYTQYPAAENVKWSVRTNDEGNKFYQATLKYQDNKVVAVLARNGALVYEDIRYSEDSSPLHIVDYAQTNFEKGKIVGVHKHTNFLRGPEVQKIVNYQLVVKVGKHEEVVWFDEAMYRHDRFETSTLAIK